MLQQEERTKGRGDEGVDFGDWDGLLAAAEGKQGLVAREVLDEGCDAVATIVVVARSVQRQVGFHAVLADYTVDTTW